jgi:hypothetical protein
MEKLIGAVPVHSPSSSYRPSQSVPFGNHR